MISVQNLTLTYPRAAAPAGRGLDFRVEPGEIFGFLGVGLGYQALLVWLLLRRFRRVMER